ncbi:MAG: DUF2207 domain-containing protein, partial [Candidatus Verstraetearchaeota archaeon]|nr:DUF2207 domain-containing protein [Candidatus Verstraetearchaeota archaeon]
MSETKQMTILFVLAVSIAIVGFYLLEHPPAFFNEDVWVESYDASVYPNGTLVEEYVYKVAVSGKYRMLYRGWDAPLSRTPLEIPHIQLVSYEAPSGPVPYQRYSSGEVWVPPSNQSPSIIDFIASNSELNEVGIYAPSYFEAGTYRVRYVFSICPPIEYDSSDAHINLRLADQHLEYRNAAIRVVSPPSGDITDVFVRPLTMQLAKTGGQVFILGSVQRDQLLEVELLFPREALADLQGFPREVQGVRVQTERANLIYSLPFYAASSLREFSRVVALLMPFLLLGAYLVYGREKHYTVPKYLSFVPDTSMKPWVANLVFRGDPFVFDENGLY